MKKNEKFKKDIIALYEGLKDIFGFKKNNINLVLILVIITLAFVSGVLVNNVSGTIRKHTSNFQNTSDQKPQTDQEKLIKIQNNVIRKGYIFSVQWGDLGKKMVADGVIDKKKLAKAVVGSDSLPVELDRYLTDSQNQIEINQQNAQFWIDVLWALGLSNNNSVLTTGPMVENQTANFASTGGYTLGTKKAMDLYAKSSYIQLSDVQQNEVEEIAGNIYRPCCGNSTVFPDCNHGMAALGLIELMVSQNIARDNIYKTVLVFNTYWFSQTYLDTAYYFQQNGRNYEQVSAKELLSKTFSSAEGSEVIHKKVGNLPWPALASGGSCGA